MQVALRNHPAHRSRFVAEVYVDVQHHSEPDLLDLWYVAQGDLDRIVIPPPTEARRAENLWQTTCFELFLGDGSGAYYELNFSPSGEWAAYFFTGYRQGLRVVQLPEPPIISTATTPWGALETHVTVPLEALASIEPILLHPTAIIEETDGERSYWAFAHPPGDPDFHHPDCFRLELPPPARA